MALERRRIMKEVRERDGEEGRMWIPRGLNMRSNAFLRLPHKEWPDGDLTTDPSAGSGFSTARTSD